MKYLKYFETEAAYTAYKDGSDYVLPNVSYIEDGNKVEYNPENKIVYPVHINICWDSDDQNYYRGYPAFALLFEAIYPSCAEHFTTWEHPTSNTAFDVSEYGTWEFNNNGIIYSTVYGLYRGDINYFAESWYEDKDGIVYDYSETPLTNVVKVDSIYINSFGGEAIKRYTTSDGQYFYSHWAD